MCIYCVHGSVALSGDDNIDRILVHIIRAFLFVECCRLNKFEMKKRAPSTLQTMLCSCIPFKLWPREVSQLLIIF